MSPRMGTLVLLWLLLLLAPPATGGEPARAAKTDRYGDPLPAGAVARLGTVRFRHGGSVRCAIFSADSKTLTSYGSDSTIRVWAVPSGKELRSCRHRQSPNEFATETRFSADGKLLALAWWSTEVPEKDPTLSLCEARTGKERKRFTASGAEAPFWAIAFSPDTRRLAAADRGGNVHLWEVSSGKRLHVLRGDKDKCSVRSIRFAPDGRTLATTGEKGSIQLWDANKGKLLRRHADKGDSRALVAFSRDGKMVATVHGDNIVRLRDSATWKERRQFRPPWAGTDKAPREGLVNLCFSPDSKRFLTKDGDGSIHGWDIAIGKIRYNLATERESVIGFEHELAVSPNDRWLASWNGSQSALRLWDLTTGKVRTPAAPPRSALTFVALTPDGTRAALGSNDGQVGFWNVARAQPLWQRSAGKLLVLACFAFSPDGRTLAMCEDEDKISLWQTATGKGVTRLGGDNGGCYDMTFAPNSRILASVNPSRIRLWDLARGKLLREWEGGGHCLAYARDGTLLACGSQSPVWSHIIRNFRKDAIRLWDPVTGKEVPVFKGKQGSIASIDFSPDGRTLVTTAGEDVVRGWEVVTGQERCRFKGSNCARFSPDGRVVATGSESSEVLLRDVTTGKELRRLRGHRDPVSAVAFSADGKRLISGSTDSTALVWDVSGLLAERKTKERQLSAKELESAWTALADDNAARAYRAICALVLAPRTATPFLRQRLRPVTFDGRQVARWLTDLDSRRFFTRVRAAEELEKLGRLAEPALRKVLRSRPTLEVRRRVERLLDPLKEPIPPAQILRGIRAVEVLERIATPESRKLLQALAKGAPEARWTREAKKALRRLQGISRGRK